MRERDSVPFNQMVSRGNVKMTGRLEARTVAAGEDTDEDFKVLVYEALRY